MKDIKLKDDGKFELQNGSFKFTIDTLDFVRQKVRFVLKWFKGEWFYNIDLGIDYFGIVFAKGTSKSAIDNIIKIEINKIEEIAEIINFKSEITGRNLEINLKIRVGENIITIDEEL